MGLGRCSWSIRLVVFFTKWTKNIQDLLRGWDAQIQFELVGEEPFFVKIENGRMHCSTGLLSDPTVTIKGSADVLYKILKGEMDADEAFNLRRYEVIGSITDGTKFRLIGEKVQESHKTIFPIFKKISPIFELLIK